MEIALLQGGRSSERPISLKTGEAVGKALKQLGYHVTPLDADSEGLRRLMESSFDFCFVALHGKGGEDGTIQGFLNAIGLPYNGSGVLASAICMDKIITKAVFQANGLPTPSYMVLEDTDISFGHVAEQLGLPFVLKPAAQGSTIGVHCVASKEEFQEALTEIRQLQDRIIAEKYIAGKELTVALLGEEVLPVMEIETPHALYDFEAKYKEGKAIHHIPARVSESVVHLCEKLSLQAARATGCTGVVRVDLRVDRQGNPWLLEINTLPGLTAVSLVPECARARGLSFPDLVEWIVKDGIKKKEELKAS